MIIDVVDLKFETLHFNRRYNPTRYGRGRVRNVKLNNEYLLWIHDFDVPFTNNLSERGLRGAKSKMKATGQFWNVESASWYATIRTYIETCNRNNVNIYNALLKFALKYWKALYFKTNFRA